MTRIDLETFFNTSEAQRFAYPGRLLWGIGCRGRVLELLPATGSVALWVDEHFATAPLAEELRMELGERLTFERTVAGMPQTTEVDAAVRAGAGRVESVVAFGGGSTTDAAKAVIAQGLYGTYDGVGMGERRGLPPLEGARKPLFIALPTTAGTGAECSRYYVTYDSRTGAKVHGKSWCLLADWTFLDPYFLREAPAPLLAASAFDAFVHCFESFVCRGERSWFGDMLSVEGICRVLGALHSILYGQDHGDAPRLELLYAASIGGIAISNVRTGDIHEAGGALLECSELTHPETLFVFFREAIDQYRDAIAEREARLLPEVAARAPQLRVSSLEDLMTWWEQVFADTGLSTSIADKLARVTRPWADVERRVVERVRADRVWAEKESPIPLSNGDIEVMVGRSLRGFDPSGKGR